jgi:hypothetical protein
MATKILKVPPTDTTTDTASAFTFSRLKEQEAKGKQL